MARDDTVSESVVGVGKDRRAAETGQLEDSSVYGTRWSPSEVADSEE